MNDEVDFKKLARRVKFRRWLVTIFIAIAVSIGVIVGGYVFSQRLASKASLSTMNLTMDLETVLSPNIKSSDAYLTDGTFMGGNITSHRYKEIEGYRVAWSPVKMHFSGVLGNSGFESYNTTDVSKTGVYDRITQQKIPMLYNLKADQSQEVVKAPHELGKVAQSKNMIAEVGITFKRPMTYAQIQAKLPANLHSEWYWIGVSGDVATSGLDNNLAGVQASNSNGKLTNGAYQDFRKAMVKVHKSGIDWSVGNYSVIKHGTNYVNHHTKLSQAKFAGIIVTGKSENFKAINGANWIYASSVGYFEPVKSIH
ncbi:sigma factor regulator N-terminal domain-containing protein [Lactiplantibacillus fabifermentans]|uniref:ECF-type sigma factor negative effector n=2 Tax=Lactiplantibacillus fabifermentans TaxID=483011 RepID=A0A0R2NIC2_9LACO|nr:anti sigma factor C-terminal domain-containing protein [Lactiplantibacillus fabifermentans]ETY73122.1 ECF-type sigma factor negative effector [Lactiplantibacillus fabifermentans T30PCM01]KRO25542.1 hypothetical protein DY78_GL001206 [Lactiplantibacillus fabifermentans DSM 21115]